MSRRRAAVQAQHVRARFTDARRCRAGLAKLATAGGAKGLGADLAGVGATLKAMGAKAVAGKAFGAKATALRKTQSRIVARRFGGETLHGVSFSQVYDDIECIDVKIEAGRAERRRLLRQAPVAPLKSRLHPPRIRSRSAATSPARPWRCPARFAPDDTEFWTSALTVPAAGMVTEFRLKTGDNPVDLPLRFSVVRPRGDGTVVVITTTNPIYPLKAHDAGVHRYPTSALSFVCCKVQAGDIVTVDNSGTTTPDAYVWFAARPDTTTFSHTSNGDSQNAGVVWSPITHTGYEVLLQVVLQPE